MCWLRECTVYEHCYNTFMQIDVLIERTSCGMKTVTTHSHRHVLIKRTSCGMKTVTTHSHKHVLIKRTSCDMKTVARYLFTQPALIERSSCGMNAVTTHSHQLMCWLREHLFYRIHSSSCCLKHAATLPY